MSSAKKRNEDDIVKIEKSVAEKEKQVKRSAREFEEEIQNGIPGR